MKPTPVNIAVDDTDEISETLTDEDVVQFVLASADAGVGVERDSDIKKMKVEA